MEARSWTGANTVILYAHSEGNGGEAAALFTLKFDGAGNWKIIKVHQMSKKEIVLGMMISIETYMTDIQALVSENFPWNGSPG